MEKLGNKIQRLLAKGAIAFGMLLVVFTADLAEGGRPFRQVAIIVSDEGYYPSNIHVFSGEKVRIFLTSLSSKEACIVIPSKKVFMSAPQHRMVYQDINFDLPGKVLFYCPSSDIKGQFIVAGKGGDLAGNYFVDQENQVQKIKGNNKMNEHLDQKFDWNPKDF